MDGKMQWNYTHGVAEASEVKGKGNLPSSMESDRRMCIVFHHGKKKMYKKDTGAFYRYDGLPWTAPLTLPLGH